MADYFDRLLARARGTASVLTPPRSSRYEPSGSVLPTPPDVVRIEPEKVGDDEGPEAAGHRLAPRHSARSVVGEVGVVVEAGDLQAAHGEFGGSRRGRVRGTAPLARQVTMSGNEFTVSAVPSPPAGPQTVVLVLADSAIIPANHGTAVALPAGGQPLQITQVTRTIAQGLNLELQIV